MAIPERVSRILPVDPIHIDFNDFVDLAHSYVESGKYIKSPTAGKIQVIEAQTVYAAMQARARQLNVDAQALKLQLEWELLSHLNNGKTPENSTLPPLGPIRTEHLTDEALLTFLFNEDESKSRRGKTIQRYPHRNGKTHAVPLDENGFPIPVGTEQQIIEQCLAWSRAIVEHIYNSTDDNDIHEQLKRAVLEELKSTSTQNEMRGKSKSKRILIRARKILRDLFHL